MNDSLEISVSVVMPAFNAEKTVAQAISSVLAQTHRNLELLIVDDNSTDRTSEIAAEYARRDPRVRCFKNPRNLGTAGSRNFGVERAGFEYIAFIDSDDMWAPEKLEKQLTLLKKDPHSSLFFTGSAFMDESGNRYAHKLCVPEHITYRQLLKQNLISCSSVLARRETLICHPMQEAAGIHEDFATWLSVLRSEGSAAGLNEPLLIYRIHGSSKSANKLRAAGMQWRTYRHVGLNSLKAAYYFVFYAVRSLRKYRRIFSK